LTASDGISKAEPDALGLSELRTVLRLVDAGDPSHLGLVASSDFELATYRGGLVPLGRLTYSPA
jgi:hypothetical protein